MSEEIAEVIPGYLCSCGFTTDDKVKFLAHCGSMARKEGADKHHTMGKINLVTGEQIMPPYHQRTKDQIYETKYKKKRPTGPVQSEVILGASSQQDIPFGASDISKKSKGNGNAPKPTITGTNILSDATQLRFIPRVFTCNLTPIMLLGYEVAIRKWGWRPDMPFENFLDTIIYNYMFEHGTQLQGAITIFDDEAEPEPELEPELEPETEMELQPA